MGVNTSIVWDDESPTVMSRMGRTLKKALWSAGRGEITASERIVGWRRRPKRRHRRPAFGRARAIAAPRSTPGEAASRRAGRHRNGCAAPKPPEGGRDGSRRGGPSEGGDTRSGNTVGWTGTAEMSHGHGHGGTEETENFSAVPPFPPLLRVRSSSARAATDLPDMVGHGRRWGETAAHQRVHRQRQRPRRP